jgi:quercetin dioxygenase-like cupin family protein
MRKQFTNSSLCIDAGTTVSGTSNQAEMLIVTSGKVWITVEGSKDDYWLQVGESITVEAGRLIVIEADKQDSRVSLPYARDGHRSFDFFAPLRAFATGAESNSKPASC